MPKAHGRPIKPMPPVTLTTTAVALTPEHATPSTTTASIRTYPDPITLDVCMACGVLSKTITCKNCGAKGKRQAWKFIGARRA